MPDEPLRLPAEIDTSVPNSARMYDYFLGGSHNFAADREAGERVRAAMPQVVEVARGNRDFLRRAVIFCQSEGIDQFLDLGSGIPTVGNVHEVARRRDPHARVAYVDYEAVAVATSEAVLDGDPLSTITTADLRDVDAVLSAPGVAGHLDLSRPVALLTLAVLHFVPDSDRPVEVMARYRERLAPGSMHVLSHATSDFDPERMAEAGTAYRATSNPLTLRSRAEVEALVAGLELVEPGVAELRDWRPDADAVRQWGGHAYGVVGRVVR